jgi:DNA-binding response OmpR family regulator
MRILVADDDCKAAELLASYLIAMGHDVKIAHDGEEALSIASWFQPAMAFLDIDMPFLSGYDVARKLRASDPSDALVLTAVTGFSNESERRAYDSGFNHFLMKPVDLAILEFLVISHLPEPRGR